MFARWVETSGMETAPRTSPDPSPPAPPPHGLRVALATLGCRLNEAETASIGQRFVARGYTVVPFGEPADVCVVNSCTVTLEADRKCRQLVRQALKRNPETFVAVVGCYAQVGHEALQRIDGLDLIVGSAEKLNVVELIDERPGKRPAPEVVRPRPSREAFALPSEATEGAARSLRANLKVQDGCDFMCAFCLIPFARGRARSRAVWDIQREAQARLAAGHKELVLTGVNIGTYAHDGRGFTELVEMLERLPGLERLRISSIEPTTVESTLIRHIANSKVLCPHVHIPLQAGSDRVLAAMKRQHTQRDFLALLEEANEHMPDAMLATDLMVGFPGESDADFAETLRVMRESPLVYAHIFRYSERPGTAAARRPASERVAPEVKRERSEALHELSREKFAAWRRRFEGRTVRVLTEQLDTETQTVSGTSDEYLKVRLPLSSMPPSWRSEPLNRLLTARVTAASESSEVVDAWVNETPGHVDTYGK